MQALLPLTFNVLMKSLLVLARQTAVA